MRRGKRGCFGALMSSEYIECSVENKTIRLAHDWLFDLSIQKIRRDRTIIIIIIMKAFGNSLELQTFISHT